MTGSTTEGDKEGGLRKEQLRKDDETYTTSSLPSPSDLQTPSSPSTSPAKTQPQTQSQSHSQSQSHPQPHPHNHSDPEKAAGASSSPPNDESSPESNKDVNLVTWEGPDDPENPRNWTMKKKWINMVTLSFFTLISPISSSMAAPALVDIGDDLGVTGGFAQALILSIFVLAYALGPLFWGPMSELYGRKVNMQCANIWFLCFNLGCALSRNPAEIIVFRFLSGLGGSAPLAIGGGVLNDTFTPEQRGKAIAIYSLMPLVGPAVGPIAGGFIAENTTWRWVFYSTTIACGIIQVAGFFLLKETYVPVLLGWKKDRLIKETDNDKLHTEYDHADRTVAQTLRNAFVRPFRLLATQPIVQALAVYMAFLYGLLYLVLASYPRLWAEVYDESVGIAGLNYLSLGVGLTLGAQVTARLQDRIYAGMKRRYGIENGPGRPEFRVPLMVPGAVLVPAGLFIYAWTADAKTHWIAPNIGAAIAAFGTIMAFQCLTAYVVDSYAMYAASALASVVVLRSLAGFGFPLFAPAMYDSLGYGWGGTILAVAGIVIGWPAPAIFWFYGPKLREMSQYAR